MKTYFAVALLAFATGRFAWSQVAPAATTASADLRYAMRYSETTEFADTFGPWHTLDTSGSLDYTNGSTRRPLSLDYTGGYTSTISGPAYATGAFHRLVLTQGFDWRKWFLSLVDDVSYRPQAPSSGFSGVPGTGEPVAPGPHPPTTQLIFTVNTHALENGASGQIQHTMSFGAFRVDAHQDLLRYPDGNGLDTDQFSIGTGSTLRLDARNSFDAHYSFSRFSYPDFNTQFRSNSLVVGYDRVWSRTFRSSVSAGPEWVARAALVPGSTGLSADATLTYQAHQSTASVAYSRGTYGGSGYLMGAEGDSLTGSYSRDLAKTFTFEMYGGYRHTADLASKSGITGDFGSVETSWRISRYLTAFLSYTATSQSSSVHIPSNVLNGLLQTVSFGVGFTKDMKAAK